MLMLVTELSWCALTTSFVQSHALCVCDRSWSHSNGGQSWSIIVTDSDRVQRNRRVQAAAGTCLGIEGLRPWSESLTGIRSDKPGHEIQDGKYRLLQ